MASTSRRGFLAGLMAATLVPRPTWADAGSPAFLSAAMTPSGNYILCGINADLGIVFQIPLPDRGHAAAAHPTKPEAVAFARRPGTFAVVIECVTGNPKAKLTSPEGRHFYGHGAFSQDGNWLYTTENDFEAGQGRIGVWDVAAGYKRTAEFASGGIGPHDIKRLSSSDTLVVANGGIDTHPDTGRTKLNIPTMKPNLAYIDDGAVVELAELSPDMHKNSIRHLAVSSKGQVAFGMQWQADDTAPVLVGTHKRGTAAALLQAPAEQLRQMQGYVGSIAFGADDVTVAVTSPRGGLIQTYDAQSGTFVATQKSPDASGVARRGAGFVVTTGLGHMLILGKGPVGQQAAYGLAWDNHLIEI